MVDKRYMLDRPDPPSPLKIWFDQSAMPLMIDAAAAVERQLELASLATRRMPVTAIGAACGIGYVTALLVSLARSPRT